MSIVLGILRRNLTLFFRDPMNVFFSLLGALVVFLLYVLFLGNVQVESVTAVAPQADAALVRDFVDAWMFAGIIALSTVTTPLGALAVFVEDAASGRFRDFMVSPVRRGQLVLGYLLGALVIGLLITVVVLLVALAYLWAVDGVLLAPEAILRSIGWITLSTAGFTALWAFVVSFLRSTGAFTAVSTIVGTVAGFVAGAYIAVGIFPSAVRDTVSALPFAQSAMLLRAEFAAEPLAALVGGSEEAIAQLSDFYGLTLRVGDWSVPGWLVVVTLAVIAVAFTALAARRIRSRIR